MNDARAGRMEFFQSPALGKHAQCWGNDGLSGLAFQAFIIHYSVMTINAVGPKLSFDLTNTLKPRVLKVIWPYLP